MIEERVVSQVKKYLALIFIVFVSLLLISLLVFGLPLEKGKYGLRANDERRQRGIPDLPETMVEEADAPHLRIWRTLDEYQDIRHDVKIIRFGYIWGKIRETDRFVNRQLGQSLISVYSYDSWWNEAEQTFVHNQANRDSSGRFSGVQAEWSKIIDRKSADSILYLWQLGSVKEYRIDYGDSSE